MRLDHNFAHCLILENQNEVSAAKLAAQRSQNADVKKFAEMMQRDHSQFIAQLEQFGGTDLRQRLSREGKARESAADESAPRREPAATAPAAPAAQPGTTAAPVAGAPPGDLTPTFIQIQREIADECLASTERELGAKSGAEFDSCYMGSQVGAHKHMIDKLKVLERHASAALQPVLHKGLETAQKHLDEAKKILKDVDHRVTAREETTKAK